MLGFFTRATTFIHTLVKTTMFNSIKKAFGFGSSSVASDASVAAALKAVAMLDNQEVAKAAAAQVVADAASADAKAISDALQALEINKALRKGAEANMANAIENKEFEKLMASYAIKQTLAEQEAAVSHYDITEAAKAKARERFLAKVGNSVVTETVETTSNTEGEVSKPKPPAKKKVVKSEADIRYEAVLKALPLVEGKPNEARAKQVMAMTKEQAIKACGNIVAACDNVTRVELANCWAVSTAVWGPVPDVLKRKLEPVVSASEDYDEEDDYASGDSQDDDGDKVSDSDTPAKKTGAPGIGDLLPKRA